MSHCRKTIRSAFATILKSGMLKWQMVTESRIPSQRQAWPYLMVFAESESSNVAIVNNPTVYERVVNITVAGMLRLPGSGDTGSIEDAMDAMAVELETKLTQTTLRVIVPDVKNVELVSTNMNVILEEDGVDHAELTQVWRVTYWVTEGLPEIFN